MSDLSAFRDDSFSSCEWINEAVSDMTDDEKIDSFLASTAMKLHMVSQEYTDQLESSMMEFMSIVPKTLHLLNDTEESIASVQQNLESMNGSAGASASMNVFDKTAMLPNIDDLSRLDITKSNMKKCIDVLKEHAYWNQLVRETSLFLENGGRLVDVAEKLEAMYRSLHILASLPGDEDRQAQFKTLRETVLGNLRPRVQNDVNNNDLTSLQEYFHIYEKLGKKEELQQEYTLLRAKSLLYIWDLAPVADLVAGSSAGTASADSTPVKQQAAMALAVSMVAVKPAQFVTQWSEWLDKLEQGVATLLTRSHDDIVVLFGSSAESAGAAGVQRYYSSVLCKILLSALEQLPAVLLSVFQQMRSIQNTPTGATDLCYSTYVKINGIVSRCVYVHLQHADSAEVLSCLRVFYDAFVTWSGLSVHFPVVPAATLSARSGHYIADNERSIAHVLLNQKQSLQQLRFDVLVGAQTADASVAASSAAAASNSIVVSESLDISELFITFNDLLLSCSDFSAQEGDSGDRDSGGKGGTVLHRYLSRSVRFLHGIALRPMLTNVAGVLMLYVQGFTHRLKDLRAAFGLPVGIFQDADNSEYGETARLGSTPAKISSSLGSQRTAGSNHGDVASVLWAEKLAQKLQQQSGDDSSQGLGGGMYALGMNVSELVYTPSALKALQAVGRLARTLVQFEGDCVAQVATLGSELQVLLSIPVAESTGAAAGAVISADPGLDLVVQKLCQGNGSFARELTGFINLHCTRAAAAESAGAAGGSKHVNVFVSVFEQLGVLKGTIGGTVVDLFLRTPVRHFAQLAADKSLWAAPSPAEGGRLTDHVPQTSFTLYGEYMLTVIHEIESFVVNFNSVGADSAQEGAGVDHTGLADILSLNSQRLCTTLPARYWMRLQGQGGAGGLSVPATAHPAIRVVESALFGSALTGDAEIDEDPEWVSPDPGQTGLGLEGVEASQPISKYELLMHHYAGQETASQPNATPVAELEEDFIAHYVSNWCGAVNSSLLGVIFSEVYAIPVLSPLGLMQLRTDLIYTQNVANTLGIRPHPLLTHTIETIGKITGDLDCTENGYLATVKSIVTTKTMQSLRDCITTHSKDSNVVLLCELTLKIFSAIAQGHQIEVKG